MSSKHLEKSCLNLIFSFSIDGEERVSPIEINLEHSQGIICFSLPFNLNLSIPEAILLSKEPKESNFIYAFEFNSLNDALDWMKYKKIHVEQKSKTGDVYSLQKEMNVFMEEYESRERNKKKKTKVVDEDGFSYYV